MSHHRRILFIYPISPLPWQIYLQPKTLFMCWLGNSIDFYIHLRSLSIEQTMFPTIHQMNPGHRTNALKLAGLKHSDHIQRFCLLCHFWMASTDRHRFLGWDE